jgi:membrane protein implicated in regulation of membrane protease activity
MLLVYVYIAAFVLGASLLCASMFLGHHAAEVGADADLDHADVGGDTDVQVEADAHLEADGHAEIEAGHGVDLSDFWLPFVSLRFWIFFLCFFGLTGALFSLLGLAGKWTTLLLALAVGVLTGFAAAMIIQYLRKYEVGQAATEEDLKGQEAVVLLPLSPGGKGKVRLEVRGQTVDMVAVTDEPNPIETGRRVVVIDIRDNQAVVVSAGALVA